MKWQRLESVWRGNNEPTKNEKPNPPGETAGVVRYLWCLSGDGTMFPVWIRNLFGGEAMTRVPSFTVMSPWRDTQDFAAHDTPERRAEYINDHTAELVEWLRDGYPDILDEFIENRRWDYS